LEKLVRLFVSPFVSVTSLPGFLPEFFPVLAVFLTRLRWSLHKKWQDITIAGNSNKNYNNSNNNSNNNNSVGVGLRSNPALRNGSNESTVMLMNEEIIASKQATKLSLSTLELCESFFSRMNSVKSQESGSNGFKIPLIVVVPAVNILLSSLQWSNSVIARKSLAAIDKVLPVLLSMGKNDEATVASTRIRMEIEAFIVNELFSQLLYLVVTNVFKDENLFLCNILCDIFCRYYPRHPGLVEQITAAIIRHRQSEINPSNNHVHMEALQLMQSWETELFHVAEKRQRIVFRNFLITNAGVSMVITSVTAAATSASSRAASKKSDNSESMMVGTSGTDDVVEIGLLDIFL
jgi:hypothetical protein